MGIDPLTGMAELVFWIGTTLLAAGAVEGTMAMASLSNAAATKKTDEEIAAMKQASDASLTAAQAAPAQATADAQAAADEKRRAILAGGGLTDYTRGSGILQPTQTSPKTLLGS